MKRIVTAILLVPLASGCEDLHLQDFLPEVNFQRLDVTDIDFEHIDTDFVFSVDNPNPIDVGLSSFSYGLSLEQIELLSGDNEEGFQLEAIGSSELVLPVGMSWESAWSTVEATRGEDYVDFGLAGHFGFMTPLDREVRLRYNEDGDFPALRTPTFAFKNLRVADLDLYTQEADLELDLGVDNVHRSTLFFDAFEYTLKLEGNEVASGLIAELGGVDGADEGTLTLPVTIDLLEAGASVTSALIAHEPLNAGLAATMDVDTPFGIVPLSIDEHGRVSVGGSN